MQIDELIVDNVCTVLDAMRRLDETGLRILFIAPNGILKAVITDSDVRKFILRGGALGDSVSKMANFTPLSLPISSRSEAKSFL
ncbi:MAG: nucleotidyltransferase, partial [Oscillospiraceae bacterium]